MAGIDIASTLLTTLFGLTGVLVGSLIGPLINHRIAREYNKKGLIFNKKIEYFEKVLLAVEENKKMYHLAIKKIEAQQDSKKVKEIIEDFKKNRKHFFIMASPLYFNTRYLSDKIVRFVRVEKSIFDRFSALEKVNKKDLPRCIEQLNQNFSLLEKRGEEILIEMRKELVR
jgi:hypothetical protein